MRDSEQTRRRLATLAFIIALHAGIVVVLLRWRDPPQPVAYAPLSLFLVAPERLSRPTVMQPQPILPLDAHAALMNVTPPPTPLLGAPDTPETGAPLIDWSRELELEGRSHDTAAAGLPGKTRSPALIAPVLPAPPIHQKGDSSSSTNGETTVWLSEHCYQVSGSLLTVPDVIARAMTSRTQCILKSNAARGDLFKDLDAYKKLHPDEPVP